MTGSNFAGFEKWYGEGVTSEIKGCEFHYKIHGEGVTSNWFGEGVISKIKGCEFHYKNSVSKKARSRGEDGEEITP